MQIAPPGEPDGAREAGAGHEPLDALVGITQPRFQPDHGLPACGEAEMSRLDDSRVYRADGDLVHAIAFHRQEAIGCGLRRRVDAFAKGKTDAPAIVIEPGAGVGQALRR